MPGYPLSSGERNPQQIVNAIKHTIRGHIDCVGVVTLRTGFATTIVSTPTGYLPDTNGVTTGSLPFLFPQNAAAAAEFVSGNLYAAPVTQRGVNGVPFFTINHTNSATTGRTFSWVILG